MPEQIKWNVWQRIQKGLNPCRRNVDFSAAVKERKHIVIVVVLPVPIRVLAQVNCAVHAEGNRKNRNDQKLMFLNCGMADRKSFRGSRLKFI
jgi:hypothetical protein